MKEPNKIPLNPKNKNTKEPKKIPLPPLDPNKYIDYPYYKDNENENYKKGD